MADLAWPENAQSFLADVKSWPGVSAGKMFGWSMLKAGGSAFVFYKNDVIAVRVSAETTAQGFAIAGAEPFIPGDRIMKNWVSFSASVINQRHRDLAKAAYQLLSQP
jgi:hypothetical protein